ncbi:uncharacterized protein N7503_000448 [Penicillium pulvis]|uniref:uncharacterized protein n=1 Tax=Penicillium pulvis TaxID=1562058 RepID=UPI002547D24F|nr:uncharacterized protein N7503_000448 [Penicillium pulvis]KAJ5813698.1 hypothetical protein N7503_000448 [Penicillium pulvis]
MIQFSSSAPRDVDFAAQHLSYLLHSQGVSHAYIGSYATDLVGGNCAVPDLDLLVSRDPAKVRKQLLEDDQFWLNSQNELLYRGLDSDIGIDLFRGGGDDDVRLPDVRLVPRSSVDPSNDRKKVQSDCPFLHPSVLLLTKITPWYCVDEPIHSPRMQRAMKDFEHIKFILKWLADRRVLIDFNAFPQKPKEEHLTILRALNEASKDVEPLLRAALTPEDYSSIIRRART